MVFLSESNKLFLVRVNNLKSFADCVNELNIYYCLFERTLLYVYNVSLLPKDETDKVAVCLNNKNAYTVLVDKISSLGFNILKQSSKGILVSRGNRMLEIKLLSHNGNFYRTVKYKINQLHFYQTNLIEFHGALLNIPNDPEMVLQYIYAPNINELIRRFVATLISTQYDVKTSLKYISSNLLEYNNLRGKIIRLKSIFHYNITHKSLSLEEFRSIYFETDEVNSLMRKKHIDIITNNGKYKTVGEIIDYMSDGVSQKLLDKVVDTDTSVSFIEPIYWSKRFWLSGNNYYIYNIVSEFRYKVLPYEVANRYISKNKLPLIYTKEYYDSLKMMSDDDIERSLRLNPVKLNNNMLQSGRHRVCAMIGRIVKGKSYIPIYCFD